MFLVLVVYIVLVFLLYEVWAFENEKVRSHKAKSTQAWNEAYVESKSQTRGIEDTEITKQKIAKILNSSEEPIREVLLQRKKVLANEDATLICVEYSVDDSAKGAGLEFAVYGKEGMRRGTKQWNKDCVNGSLKNYTNVNLPYVN